MDIKIGDVCFEAAGALMGVHSCIVTERNYDTIVKFWNKCYFQTREEAIQKK